jgi:hypothetical protein
MQNTEVSIENIKYFFSLVLEDYFGDLEELMEMADIDEGFLNNFLNS